ncbi:MAG: RnfABCDGE type electron transport complex subunit D [Bacillota bacterium]
MTKNPDLISSPTPHLPGDGDTTQKVMTDVIIALTPATLAGIYFFGKDALVLIFVSVFTAIIIESVFTGRTGSLREVLGDGSAIVTGLLLALSLPPGLPWGIAAFGSAAAIILGKIVFGGLGNNIFNPALVGRALLVAIWPVQMTTWLSPVDATTTATPLSGGEAGYLEMFVGSIPGCIGETSALLLIIGAIYLFYRERITWHVPAGYLGSIVVLSPIIGTDILFQLLAGGLILAAFYMATDMVTSPVTEKGQIIFGIGCGVGTIVIREFASLPGGVTYAILLMNAFTPLLDKYFPRRAFGEVK